MTPDKCKNCSAADYPYVYTVDCHNLELPKECWVPTCSKNMAPGRMPGMYAACRPEICEGVYGRRYYVDYKNNTEENIKVIYYD